MAFDRMATSFKDAEASTATDRVRPRRPALDAAYGTAPIPDLRASREEMLIIHFDGSLVAAAGSLRLRTRLRIAARIKAREVSIAPSRFVRKIWEISATSERGRMLDMEMPAALTRTSTFACLIKSVSSSDQL